MSFEVSIDGSDPTWLSTLVMPEEATIESVIRGAVIYLLLLVILPLSGRRTMSEMTAFDFMLLLIVAEATQQALTALRAVAMTMTVVARDQMESRCRVP